MYKLNTLNKYSKFVFIFQLLFVICYLRIKSELFFYDLKFKSGLPKNSKKVKFRIKSKSAKVIRST